MEIHYRPVIREVPLPAEVEIEQAHAEQRNGLLWISLPLKESCAQKNSAPCRLMLKRSRAWRALLRREWTRVERRASLRNYRFCPCAGSLFFLGQSFH